MADGGPGSTKAGAEFTYLNCPQCGLTLAPKADWLAVAHCPRCVARRGALVTLFPSTLPSQMLYADGAGPDPGRLDVADNGNGNRLSAEV